MYKLHGALVFNRVFSIDETKAKTILREKSLHIGWLHNIISEMIKTSAVKIHDTGQRGISKTLLPLNTQWFFINKCLKDVKTPAFAYGYNGLLPPIDHLASPILKSVWSYNSWRKENSISAIEITWNRFFVDMPSGVPVIIAFAGCEYQKYFPREVVRISEGRIKKLVDVCRYAFATEIGEIILYANGENDFTYCACSPYMGYSISHEDYRGTLLKYCKNTLIEGIA